MNRTEQIRATIHEESEWQKLYYKHQQSYKRKRLEAIKYLQEGKSRTEVMAKLGCARQSLISWIDLYCEGGLEALVRDIKSNRIQRLSQEQKEKLKKMLLEEKPTDYEIDRQIWTGKILIEVIEKRWGITLKDSRVYDILKELGLSHQKAHRDYQNGDPKVQAEFVATLKKNGRPATRRAVCLLR